MFATKIWITSLPYFLLFQSLKANFCFNILDILKTLSLVFSIFFLNVSEFHTCQYYLNKISLSTRKHGHLIATTLHKK